MRAPTDTALSRSLRWFTLGSGPLKRGSDRLQVAGRLVVVLALLAAPPLAVAATTVTTAQLEARAEAEAAERSRVDAVLLEDAPAPEAAGSGYGDREPVKVPARAVWPVPGGAERQGVVLARPRTAAGTAVPVWVNRAGNVTSAPLDRSRTDSSAMMIGAVVLLGVPLATWMLYAFLRAALDAHRGRRWAQGWAAVEPEWVSRLL